MNRRGRLTAGLLLLVVALGAWFGWSRWRGSEHQVAHRAASELREMPGVEKSVLRQPYDDSYAAEVVVRPSASRDELKAVLARADELDDSFASRITVHVGSADVRRPMEAGEDAGSVAAVVAAVSAVGEGRIRVYAHDEVRVVVPKHRGLPVTRKTLALLASRKVDGVRVGAGSDVGTAPVQVDRQVRSSAAVAVLDRLMPLAGRAPHVNIGRSYGLGGGSVEVTLRAGTRQEAANALRAAQAGAAAAWPSAAADSRRTVVYLDGPQSVTLRGSTDPARAVTVLDRLQQHGVHVDDMDTELEQGLDISTVGPCASVLPQVASGLTAAGDVVPADAVFTMHPTGCKAAGVRADIARVAGPLAALSRQGYGIDWHARPGDRVGVGLTVPEGKPVDADTARAVARAARSVPWSGTAAVTITLPITDTPRGVTVVLTSTRTGRAHVATPNLSTAAEADQKIYLDAWNATAVGR